VQLAPFIVDRLTKAKGALTTAALAELFNLSEPQILKLTNRAQDPLPSFKLHSSRRFDPTSTLEWFKREVAA
jgi:hypothetical protein